MNIILFFIAAYILIKVLMNMNLKTEKLKFYASRFRIGFPENLSKTEKSHLIDVLIQYDTPELPEDKLLEYVAARMRTIPFPEGTTLWKDDKYIIL